MLLEERLLIVFIIGSLVWACDIKGNPQTSNILSPASVLANTPGKVIGLLGSNFVLKNNEYEFSAIVLKWTLENII